MIKKGTDEVKDFTLNFTGEISRSATIDSATVAFENYNGGATADVPTAPTPAVAGKIATIRVSGGALGRIYSVAVHATISDGQILRKFHLLKIIDLARECV